MTAEKLGKPISFIYGEQGKYSLARNMSPAPEPVPPALPVHFVNVTSLSRIAFAGRAHCARKGDARFASNSPARRRMNRRPPQPLAPPSLANFLGSGACIIDYDGDGKPDIFLVNADGKGNAALYRNISATENSSMSRKPRKLDLHGDGMSCAVGDYDNDGNPDLAVSFNGRVLLFHNEGNGTFKDVTEAAGIRPRASIARPDLHRLRPRRRSRPLRHPLQRLPARKSLASHSRFRRMRPPPGNVLWRNNGNGTFTDWTKETGLAGAAPSVAAHRQRHQQRSRHRFRRHRLAEVSRRLFQSARRRVSPATPWILPTCLPPPPALSRSISIKTAGWTSPSRTGAPPGLSLWRNVEGKSFERVKLPDLGWMRGWGVAPLDYDNDGWIDLVAVGETFSGEGRIALLRNEGPAGFRDVTAETGLDKIVLHNPRGVIAFDFDGDGATDLLITQNNLPPVLLKNIGGNQAQLAPTSLSKASTTTKPASARKLNSPPARCSRNGKFPALPAIWARGPPISSPASAPSAKPT